MAADERTWTTHQLARLSGMSYRQADYLARTGVLVPVTGGHGSGSHRRWASRQVAVARVLACLADLGATAEVRRPVADVLLTALPAVWATRIVVDLDGRVHHHPSRVPVVAGWLVDLAQVWADAEQAMAAELDGELALVG